MARKKSNETSYIDKRFSLENVRFTPFLFKTLKIEHIFNQNYSITTTLQANQSSIDKNQQK